MSLIDQMQVDGRSLTATFGSALAAPPSIDLSIEVAGQVTVELKDPDGALFRDGGLLDRDSDDLLDRDIELTMPVNGRSVAYRIAKVSVTGTRVTLAFEDRTSDLLRRHRQFLKLARKRTANATKGATFGQWGALLVDEVKHPKIRRVIPEINQLGGVLAPDLSSVVGDGTQEADVTSTGFDSDEKLKVKGAPVTAAQLSAIERVQRQLDKDKATGRARLAATLAPIGESTYNAGARNGKYGGLYQSPNPEVEGQVHDFLKGGGGFQGGGAIKYAKDHPDASPGAIVTAVEASGKAASFYEGAAGVSWVDEAKKIISAWGGDSTDSSEFTANAADYAAEDYQFTRGEPGKPESSWDALGRQADDRGWRRFAVLNTFYLASEERLYKSKSVMTLDLTNPAVLSLDYEWAPRKQVSTVNAVVNMAHGDVLPGNVVAVRGRGPANGRYLVTQIVQDADSPHAQVTARLPINRKPEPANEVTTLDDGTSTAMVANSFNLPIREEIVARAKATMTVRTGFNRYSQQGALTEDPTPASPNRTDCSQWARAIYLNSGAPDPGSYTGAMLAKGRLTTNPKPGDLLVSASHVEMFIGNGKTIGHGTAPIDEARVSDFPGFQFRTYLND